MSPFGPLDSKEEQSEEERLAVARRYRDLHTRELHDLAAPAIGGDPTEVGEFSTIPIEAFAAIPVLGALLALAVRARSSRRRLGSNVLVALDAENVHLLSLRSEVEGRRAEPVGSWPRAGARVSGVRQRFMRVEVTIELEGEQPLRLYASSLRTNPWAAAVVRALGGEAPDPLDLGSPASPDGT